MGGAFCPSDDDGLPKPPLNCHPYPWNLWPQGQHSEEAEAWLGHWLAALTFVATMGRSSWFVRDILRI